MLWDCPERGCGRRGVRGFSRKDHFNEHLKKVHANAIPTRKGRRKRDGNAEVGAGSSSGGSKE